MYDKLFEPLIVIGVLQLPRHLEPSRKESDYPVILYETVPKAIRATWSEPRFSPEISCNCVMYYCGRWGRCNRMRVGDDCLCKGHRKRANRVSIVSWKDKPPHPKDRGAADG